MLTSYGGIGQDGEGADIVGLVLGGSRKQGSLWREDCQQSGDEKSLSEPAQSCKGTFPITGAECNQMGVLFLSKADDRRAPGTA